MALLQPQACRLTPGCGRRTIGRCSTQVPTMGRLQRNGLLRALLSRFGRRWRSLPAHAFSRCGGRGIPAGVARLSADVLSGKSGW